LLRDEGSELSTETKIELAGPCDIHSASQRRTDLIEALRGGDEVRIDAERAEYLDLAFVQLLVSASKTAAACRKRLRFAPVSQPFRDAFARAGLTLSATQDQIVLP
jgi:anti-anti-sigma regulatory factor